MDFFDFLNLGIVIVVIYFIWAFLEGIFEGRCKIDLEYRAWAKTHNLNGKNWWLYVDKSGWLENKKLNKNSEETIKEEEFQRQLQFQRQEFQQQQELQRQHIRESIFNEPNSVQPIQTELLNLKKDEHCYVKAEMAEWIIGFGDSFNIEDIGILYVTNSRIIFNGQNKNNIINFNKIMTTDYFYDSFEMAVENRKSIIALGNLNCEYVCKIEFLIEGQQEKIETAKEMIAYKIDIDAISKHTGLSVDSIEKIKKSMEL